jgi:hypothetical protein
VPQKQGFERFETRSVGVFRVCRVTEISFNRQLHPRTNPESVLFRRRRVWKCGKTKGVVTKTRRVSTCRKTSTDKSRILVFDTTFLEKKSHCHNVLACSWINSSRVPAPRFGPVSNPLRLRIFFTVLRVTDCMPNFFNSPKIRLYPQPVSLANLRISLSISCDVRRRPSFSDFFSSLQPHESNVVSCSHA